MERSSAGQAAGRAGVVAGVQWRGQRRRTLAGPRFDGTPRPTGGTFATVEPTERCGLIVITNSKMLLADELVGAVGLADADAVLG